MSLRLESVLNYLRASAHLDGLHDLANHVAGMHADHATAQDLTVTMGLWAGIKQQLGDPFIAAVGNGTP